MSFYICNQIAEILSQDHAFDADYSLLTFPLETIYKINQLIRKSGIERFYINQNLPEFLLKKYNARHVHFVTECSTEKLNILRIIR